MGVEALTLEFALLLSIAVPFIWAAVVSGLGRASARVQGGFAASGMLLSTGFLVFAASRVMAEPTGLPLAFKRPWIPAFGLAFSLYVDALSLLLALVASGFGFLALLYSVDEMRREGGLPRYYMWMLFFGGSMVGLFLAGDLFTMFIFWELTSLASYGLIGFHKERLEDVGAALKAFMLTHLGGAFLLLGIFAVYLASSPHTLDFEALAGQAFTGGGMLLVSLAIASFIIAAVAKSVQFPMHNWLPSATVAPSAVTAYLHAAAMVKAGVYLLARMYTVLPGFFNVPSWNLVVVSIGCVTMLVGVMNALVQSDFKRLLAYHTISQIGYMVLGVGLGTTLGLAAGLFHLLNHALFKGCLFLCAGALIYATGSRSLDDYGGLAKRMPVTAFACLVASASISGVPPFNGFVSKWMIYGAAIEAGYAWAAVIAMFTSALTLASFAKVVHSAFLGSTPERLREVKEVPATMKIPLTVLALACILFGVFPAAPLSLVGLAASGLVPGLPLAVYSFGLVTEIGVWLPTVATLLLFLGILLGLAIYYASARVSPVAPTADKYKVFVGGEDVSLEEVSFTSHHFYSPVKSILKPLYEVGEKGGLDRLDYGIARLIDRACGFFRKVHTGVLSMYVFWLLLALLVFALMLWW